MAALQDIMYSRRWLALIAAGSEERKRFNRPGLEQVVICKITCEKRFWPPDREKMKGEDKKWLLIDSHFICLGSDDHTMQSNSIQEGAKVLMDFQTSYFAEAVIFIL